MAPLGACLKLLGVATALAAVAWPALRSPLAAQLLPSLRHRPAAQAVAAAAASQRTMAAAGAAGAGAAAAAATYRPMRPPLVIPPKAEHRSTLIMLHGLGDSGAGWAFLAQKLAADLPHTKWIFPNAPVRPITKFGGQKSAAWFDIPAPALVEQARAQDAAGLHASRRYVEELLQEQAAEGIPSDRVVVGGFSQGGAVALLMLRSTYRLAGVLALSTFLPLVDEQPLVADANAATPVFMAHGDADQMITLERAQRSVAALPPPAQAAIDFRLYQGMAHSVSEEELQDVKAFLAARLA